MFLSPIQDWAEVFQGSWVHTAPRITQRFGENPSVYAQFNLAGHNGIDYGVSSGTQCSPQ